MDQGQQHILFYEAGVGDQSEPGIPVFSRYTSYHYPNISPLHAHKVTLLIVPQQEGGTVLWNGCRPLMTASVMATMGQTLGQKHGVLDNVTMQERGSVRGARCGEEESPDPTPAN